MADEVPLHTPRNPAKTATFRLRDRVNTKFGLSLTSYYDLYLWSTEHIADFWAMVWDATSIIGYKGTHVVDESVNISQNPPWFVEAKINWAENMLHCRSCEKVALIQATEPTPLNSTPDLRRYSYAQLYDLVSRLVSALLANGLKPGDRVASYSSNCIENVVLCLATTAVGGIWVSAAADFGPAGVLERFEQVQPTFIFAVDSVVYNAKVHDHLAKLSALVSGLDNKSEHGIRPKIVIIHPIPYPEDRSAWQDGWMSWDDFILQGEAEKLGRTPSGEIIWYRASFNWPLWILFSSGSTGKAIVHRAGGMLLQAKKEFVICADLQPDDVFFYYTTTGWMMYNFLVSGLSVGCTLVLYDGSPLRDPAYLWKLTAELKITIWGTSAKYLGAYSKGYKPCDHHDLSTIRHVYSTGSPLSATLFKYVYESISPNVLLASITGGTDICSLFAGMNSALPVYAGEVQCRMLGLAVESYSEAGTLNGPDEPGELVCLKPFPCMPAGFWPLPGFGSDGEVAAARAKYHKAYFAEIEGVWYHGDHIVITRSRAGNGGGLVMLGRSDGVLNPGGIRFGSSELYDVIDSAFCSTGKILDCLAIGQTIGESDERVILFVKLPDNEVLSPALERQIKDEVRVRRSPRHVPAVIIQAWMIPYTLNGKRVEVLVKKIINGAPLSIVNPTTLSNPECLPFYNDIGVELRKNL
ncbi:acetoacetyl-CoA synthetase [Mycena maculata]|uniref:Acetoacetyl-CoA synthetase n=1 Tax=Mycena maculata TaxID=230809 RepID=A0AAD7JX96_9AGAR|nr:acetoacetyl-CoA synthetase [Mycena maculata]